MASNAEKHRLIDQAQKRALQIGGLIGILLSGNRSDIGWLDSRQQFTISGKPVPITAIRAELNTLDGQLAIIIKQYLTNLQIGVWDLQRWEDEMIKLLEDSHSIFAAIAAGGLATAVSIPVLFSRIDRDEGYLKGFSKDLKVSRTNPDRKSELRGLSYIRSANVTFAEIELIGHKAAGFTEAIRVLRALESCHRTGADGSEGCLDVSNRGWIPIDQMPPIGSLICKQWCRCYIAYR